MSDMIIGVEHLSKCYSISRLKERGDGLSHAIERAVRSPFKWLRSERSGRTAGQTLWALRDVCLEVKRGETVGIIGPNGAGKSTLLKLLSRITEPTAGRIRLRGRVASLLEVGTGFHQELTGRENIFLNGAILGMSRAEIKRKLDEIVAFAEIEKFLDTPVKRYSSGMYVRLAFAVAAHLDHEVLIVDEVLAVGDAAFQEKCLGKMEGVVRSEGRTVLFVSHQMTAVQRLCQRACLLKGGTVYSDGPAATVIGQYLSKATSGGVVDLTHWEDRIGSGEARIVSAEIGNGEGLAGSVAFGDELVVKLEAVFSEPFTDPLFGVLVHDAMGHDLVDIRSWHDDLRLGRVVGPVKIEVRVPHVNLYPGRYFLSPWITDNSGRRDIDYPRRSCMLEVLPPPDARRNLKFEMLCGTFFMDSRWRVSGPAREPAAETMLVTQ
ncbi:MAG: ABC transporter ATP-binding protein [Vicinamibacterales bacterium]